MTVFYPPNRLINLLLMLHKQVLQEWSYCFGRFHWQKPIGSHYIIVRVCVLWFQNGADFINGKKHLIYSFDVGDNKYAFVFQLKFFTAFQGTLFVVFDNYNQIIANGLSVIEIFNYPL